MISLLLSFFFHDLHMMESSIRHRIGLLRIILVKCQYCWSLEFICIFCTSRDRARIMVKISRCHPASLAQVYFTGEIFNYNRSHRQPSTPYPGSFTIHLILNRNKLFCLRWCHDRPWPNPIIFIAGSTSLSWAVNSNPSPSTAGILSTDNMRHFCISGHALKVPRVYLILRLLKFVTFVVCLLRRRK